MVRARSWVSWPIIERETLKLHSRCKVCSKGRLKMLCGTESGKIVIASQLQLPER